MLYLIGLGLNEKGISLEGIEALKKCERVYVENYTVDFPYSFEELEKVVKKKLIPADREFSEGVGLIKEAEKKDVALLIYGSPLTATTHISLIQEAIKQKIKYKIIYGASILDAVAETGLQIYKFGKITSMPKWTKSFTPKSFMKIVKENKKINAHSLILVDIGLEIKDAMNELEESAKTERIKIDKIVICSMLGTEDKKIIYNKISEIRKLKVSEPYCIIIPEKMHFVEEEFLSTLV